MPLYRVEVEGCDFPDADGDLFGFFAARWVEADSPETAELAAMELIRQEYRPHFPKVACPAVEPSLHLSRLQEVEVLPPEYANSGATWFPMDSE